MPHASQGGGCVPWGLMGSLSWKLKLQTAETIVTSSLSPLPLQAPKKASTSYPVPGPGHLAVGCLCSCHSSRKSWVFLRTVGPGGPLVPGLTLNSGQGGEQCADHRMIHTGMQVFISLLKWTPAPPPAPGLGNCYVAKDDLNL